MSYYSETRGGRTLHAPIHKGSNLGTGVRKLAGSSVITPKLNRIAENTSLVCLIGSGM